MLGVMTLIIVLSVMNGFHQDMRSKILGINSHVVVMKYSDLLQDYRPLIEQVDETPGVVAATPFVYSQVMIRAMQNISGAVLRGVDPKTVGTVLTIDKSVSEGALDRLSATENGLIVGHELAKNLGVGLGEPVTVISPMGQVTPLGRQPKATSFEIVGFLQTGMYEYDSTFIVMSIQSAQQFLGIGDRVTGLEIKVENIYKADTVAEELSKRFPYPYWIRDWMQMNRNLFAALQLEKLTLGIILTLIILVAAFNIVSTLIMVVMEKTKDIGILKSMGATSRSILKIFVLEGLVIGVVGTFLGFIGGLVLCELLKRYEFIKLPSDVYYISTFPVLMKPLDISLICFAGIAISLIATLYPAWQAARLNPVEALRYE